MHGLVTADVLDRLDRARRAAGDASGRGGVVREFSPDGSACRIVFSRCAAEEVADVIRDEVTRAETGGYVLEWKLYGHDGPVDLADALLAAGFQPDDAESVLALPVNEAALAAFDGPAYEIRRVHDADDVAEISREIGRRNVEEEKRRLEAALLAAPDELSVHVAYVDGEPVACGRIYFTKSSDLAELAGGRTKTTHRTRGLFTALVAARLREAMARNRTLVLVDALPTSEPTLRKRGFQLVTGTRPYVYTPTSRA